MNYNPAINVGDILTRPKAAGFVTHFGVAVGRNAVLQNTPGRGEHLATLNEFAVGQAVTIHRTGADPSAVRTRAQRVLANPKPYDPVWRNCQHTVFEIVQGIAKSPVVIAAVILIGLTLLAVLLTRR